MFFVTYEWSQRARVLHYILLEWLARDKHSCLSGQFVSYEENEALYTSPVLGEKLFNIFLKSSTLPIQNCKKVFFQLFFKTNDFKVLPPFVKLSVLCFISFFTLSKGLHSKIFTAVIVAKVQ
jgi:hypothetical protein